MGDKDNPIQNFSDNGDTNSTVNEIKEEDGTKEDNKSTDDNEVTIETVDNKEKHKSRGDNEPQPEPENTIKTTHCPRIRLCIK